MVLFSFSIPEHIPLIKSGTKHQTTRVPRKPHKNGSPAYKVGDKVQLYYRSRMRKSCANCIQDKKLCPIGACESWDNFFGESEIVRILHYQYGPYFENGDEIWKGYNLAEAASVEEKEKWAQADGFASWNEANHWFAHNTQDGMWAHKPLDVIIWDADPIIQRWKN